MKMTPKRWKWIIGIAIVLVLIIFLLVRNHNKTSYQFIPVTQGPITEIVSVTGNTTPIQSVSLSFANSGIISNTYADVGTSVTAGQVLAELDTEDLAAQLKQAQANVDAQTANLNSLEAGSTPQNIAVSQTAVATANQDLVNLYGSINDTATDSYAKASDAVGTQLGAMFSSNQLTFQTGNSQALIAANNADANANTTLANWQTELASITSTSSDADLDSLLQDSTSDLAVVRTLLSNVTTVLNSNTTNLNATIVAMYKTAVTTATTEVNLASKNLDTLSQNIASQKLVVAQAQAQLALTQAGSTPEAIAAQQAIVESAQAAVLSAQAKLTNSEIVAPISGIVTQFDAKVGQIADPNTPLVSIISGSQFEVDALVPETDIGKIAINDPVTMTFDAFQGQTFQGSVFYINPAETITSGVVDYEIKVAFAKPDPEMKSGLTANLDIQTNYKANVLTLPEYAILQTDSGTFVETLSGKTVVQNPVTLGIQDQNGNVEIVSGVTAGEKVINIGLK